MGVGVSTCKGLVHPQAQDPTSGEPERSLSTVTPLPFLSAFEDRPPFKPSEALSDRDASLLKALTHHRTPFAVVETDSTDLNIIYASGGCVAGMGMPAENIEGSSLAGVLKKGIKMLDEDIARLEAAVRAKEVRNEKPTHIHSTRGVLLLALFGQNKYASGSLHSTSREVCFPNTALLLRG